MHGRGNKLDKQIRIILEALALLCEVEMYQALHTPDGAALADQLLEMRQKIKDALKEAV
jgi:hypothetical protein